MVLQGFQKRVTIDLTPRMSRALSLLAAKERRVPREQAAVILERALAGELAKADIADIGVNANVVESETEDGGSSQKEMG